MWTRTFHAYNNILVLPTTTLCCIYLLQLYTPSTLDRNIWNAKTCYRYSNFDTITIMIYSPKHNCWFHGLRVISAISKVVFCTFFVPKLATYSPFHGFWKSFISIEVRRDCILALASSCKKELKGFFVCLLFFLKVKHIMIEIQLFAGDLH